MSGTAEEQCNQLIEWINSDEYYSSTGCLKVSEGFCCETGISSLPYACKAIVDEPEIFETDASSCPLENATAMVCHMWIRYWYDPNGKMPTEPDYSSYSSEVLCIY